MIVQITEGMSQLGLRIRNAAGQQLISWEALELHIARGQYDRCCGSGGSPWILTGCWPGHSTGVDVANPRHDIPTIVLPADHLSEDGLVVFSIGPKVWDLPPGRYSGLLVYAPARRVPMPCTNLPVKVKRLLFQKTPSDHGIPPEYRFPECHVEFDNPLPPPDKPKMCILSVFDIDIGPMCAQHLIDRVDVDFPVHCEVEE